MRPNDWCGPLSPSCEPLQQLLTEPVWCREILDARSPQRPSFPHREYDPVPPSLSFPPPGDMVMRTFTFGPGHVAAIKKSISAQRGSGGGKATTFKTLAAFVWRARTVALEIPADEDARLVIAASVRGVRDLGLPTGYYRIDPQLSDLELGLLGRELGLQERDDGDSLLDGARAAGRTCAEERGKYASKDRASADALDGADPAVDTDPDVGARDGDAASGTCDLGLR
uniref:Uncharacterized protein n=1 Tax=Zea mays TaxID=4577 RepID=A0A804PXM7_MAIZE